MATAHVLIADITGSTRLYDRLTDQDALGQISAILSDMRSIIEENGGHCVKSQGDDTLSFFGDAGSAFKAAQSMIEADWGEGLGVHAGAHYGDVLSQDSDIYGDAVNTAARLAALAKPGEILIGNAVFEQLSEPTRELFVSMGGVKLKGKRKATRVHSFTVSDLSTQTVFFKLQDSPIGPRTASVALTCDANEWSLYNGESLLVGRSAACGAVLESPWVSRKHGVFELRTAQLEYTDHSSSGSTVITSDGQEYALQRRSMPLSGEGMVMIGTRDKAASSCIIRYSTQGLVPD